MNPGSHQSDWMETSDPAILTKEPVVSVLMITYNHGSYIAEAIEGVLKQKTSFAFELIIGEDHSTDNTRQVAFEYQRRYPGIIRVFSSGRNEGAFANALRTFNASRGNTLLIVTGMITGAILGKWRRRFRSWSKLQKLARFTQTIIMWRLCAANGGFFGTGNPAAAERPVMAGCLSGW